MSLIFLSTENLLLWHSPLWSIKHSCKSVTDRLSQHKKSKHLTDLVTNRTILKHSPVSSPNPSTWRHKSHKFQVNFKITLTHKCCNVIIHLWCAIYFSTVSSIKQQPHGGTSQLVDAIQDKSCTKFWQILAVDAPWRFLCMLTIIEQKLKSLSKLRGYLDKYWTITRLVCTHFGWLSFFFYSTFPLLIKAPLFLKHCRMGHLNKWFWNHESRLNIHESMWIQW